MSDVGWDQDAEKAIAGVPFYARGLVRRKLEEQARNRGSGIVTLNDLKEAEARFRSVMGGKSGSEMSRMMPQENVSGVEMAIIDECHSALSNCPNVLIPTADWKRAVEDWIGENGVSERLRLRIKSAKILHHQKLRISISGCPNGCSRPSDCGCRAGRVCKPRDGGGKLHVVRRLRSRLPRCRNLRQRLWSTRA